MEGRVLWLNGKYQTGHSPRETNKQMFTPRQVNTTLTRAWEQQWDGPVSGARRGREGAGRGRQGFGLRTPSI